MHSVKKSVNSEIPINDWIYEYFSKTLLHEHIETSRKENVKNLGMGLLPEEINEYSKSKSDIVIHKDQLATSIFSDTFQWCMVSVNLVVED